MELSGEFPVKRLCKALNINRSGFYKWKNRLENPSAKMRSFIQDVQIFKEYHEKYPSHGYRWLNAKIRLDEGLVMSDQRAHRCCKFAGIVSEAKHYRYKKAGAPDRLFPNLLMTGIRMNGPLQCVVSDMTAFRANGTYYELTLYMDLWNNEIVAHELSARKGDRMTYLNGLHTLLDLKKEHPEEIKHPKEYTFYAGLIIIFLGVAALVMGVVSFFNAVASFIVIIVATLIMGIMWKVMHEKYA